MIVKDGVIVGRGQNRVLLTGCPIYHAEITAINGRLPAPQPQRSARQRRRRRNHPRIDPARARLPRSSVGAVAHAEGLRDYINAAPCPMCMSAIYWARIDRVVFGASPADARSIGFDDAFQYEDFALAWPERRIPVTAGCGRDIGLTALEAWMRKTDRHPY